MPVASPSPTSQLAYMARQPILDERSHVFGYELLYRAAAGEMATARVLTDAVINVGLSTVAHGKMAFINVSPQVLLSGAATLLPPEMVVLALLESMAVIDEVLAACKFLHARGYSLALDDFVPGSEAEALIPFAKYVKVDVLALTEEEIVATAVRLASRGLRLLAEKVETAAVRDSARAAGHRLFQGYFFCRPETISSKPLDPSQLTQMRLIAALNQPGATLTDIEGLVKRDVSISLRVLRCVNSAAVSKYGDVHSIREALLLVGLDPLRKWASIWSLASLNCGSPEIVTTAVIRAKACELLGAAMNGSKGKRGYFLLGLCSLLDGILSRPMEMALEAIPIDAEGRAALLGQPNQMRHLLDGVIHYERGEWQEATASAVQATLVLDALDTAYGTARAWADELTGSAAA